MSSVQEINRRIKAVSSTSKITRAMELVSATKMRRSQEIALLSRPYAFQALRLLGEIHRRTTYRPEIMRPREIKKTAIVLAASDRGLAGPFNTSVFQVFERRLKPEIKELSRYRFIAVGRKSEEYLHRTGLPPHQVFKDFGDYADLEEVRPLTDFLIQGFIKREWDRVVVVSTHFRSTLRQDVLVREVLPVKIENVIQTVRELIPERGRFAGFGTAEEMETILNPAVKDFEYLIEPTREKVLDELIPQLVGIELYDLILEANASEHSARMVAMKNASDNAEELEGELTIEYNKSRQAGITREISEIVSGTEALTM